MERRNLDVTDQRLVRNCYLLAGLGEEELAHLTQHAEVRTYVPGEAVFAQGEAARQFFLVLAGIVRLYRVSPQGEAKVIELIRPGALFAEAVFFMGARYPVHAAALDRVRLIAFDFQDFNSRIEVNPGLAARMMAGMARRIHDLVNEIDRLSTGSASQRLAYYLLGLLHAEPAEAGVRLRLKVPKHVIASRIGVKPETFSRMLGRLREEGVLDVQEDILILHDVAKLRAVLGAETDEL